MLEQLERLGRKRLGDVLVDEQLISKEQLLEAVADRQRTGAPLGRVLVESGYLSDWDLAKAVAKNYNMPFLILTGLEIGEDVFKLLEVPFLLREQMIPFDRFGNALCIACIEMPDAEILREIQEQTGLTPFLFVSAAEEMKRVLAENGAIEEVSIGNETVINLDLASAGGEWQKLFDVANESVIKERES